MRRSTKLTTQTAFKYPTVAEMDVLRDSEATRRIREFENQVAERMSAFITESAHGTRVGWQQIQNGESITLEELKERLRRPEC